MADDTRTDWTPGPWHLASDEDGQIFAIAGGHENRGRAKAICRFGRPTVNIESTENTANAHLMFAAPELYNALDTVLAQYRLFVGSSDSIAAATIELAKSALRKAREG